VPYAPHKPSGPLRTAATLQLGATLPNFRYLEIMAVDVPWRSEISDEHLELTLDGDVLIPDGVGLGIELNLEAIAERPYVPHPMVLFRDAVTNIRPADACSYFNRGARPAATEPASDVAVRSS
jgi:galactonate dehydratase